MVYTEVSEQQMEQLEDLLPGIEDYLCNVLSNENLSEYAEEQRQYFLERLDIIKLPPSIPPRPQSLGVRLYPVHSSPPPSSHESAQSLEHDDFAAYQRELSRALVDPDSSSNLTEVKVYDDIDIDTGDSSIFEISPCKTDEEEDEESMYEIPQRNLSDSGYEKALELSPISKSSSSQEQLSSSCNTGTPVPPPLPPRGERTGSDAASRSSIGSMLEYQSTDTVVVKPKLCRESSVPTPLSRSLDPRIEKSVEDLSSHDYYDGASCESLDEVDNFSRDRTSSLLVQLPRPMKRKHRSNHRKLGKSLTSLWEITQPFSMLEDIVLSGEVHYKSKLTWTRKIVALTLGRLVCYKIDKTDSRPSFVILLTGYKATSHKREGRRSFEVHLDHDNFESHVFLVDFKEWAETWCEHINAASIGQRAPGPNVHLARGSLMANQDCTYQMANTNNHLSNSNSSLVSCDALDTEPGMVKIKKRDQSGPKSAMMGAFAFKATQFFESFGKKSSIKKSGSVSDSLLSTERLRQSSGSQSSICDISERLGPLTPDISERLGPLTPDIEESADEIPAEVQKHIKHQGYLDIYSSFNKRKWGKRWCLIHENNFECYRTQQSDVCELEIILKKCVLRRAIEETKSELGLMLLEDNREKITIEPVSWNELGSWLRILMKETSTLVTPPGLEGYMDDTHPYHEAVEITRLPETLQKQQSLNVNTRLPASDNSAESKTSKGSRDSGIGSSVFSDDVFNSQDRKSISPQTHPCFSDSSLPRVSVCDTGAIYTQVTKKSVTGSKSKPDRSATLTGNQSTGSQTSRGNSGKDAESSEADVDNDKLFFDFGNPNFEREESLVDQIMSHLNTRLSSSGSPTFESDLTELSDNVGKRKSNEFHPNDNTLSPIKSEDTTLTGMEPVFTTLTGMEPVFMCSSFVEETQVPSTIDKAIDKAIDKDQESISNVDIDNQLSKANEKPKKLTNTVRRHPSTVSRTEENIDDILMELRTRLVQLKKDRISIRDRKHHIVSKTDKDFLEAEYERLNRECKKVSDEINMYELHLNGQSQDSSDLTQRNLDEDCMETNNDVDTDVSTKVNTDVGTDVGIKVNTDFDADVSTKVNTDVDADVGTKVNTDNGTDVGTKVDFDDASKVSNNVTNDVSTKINIDTNIETLCNEGRVDSNEMSLNNIGPDNLITEANFESVIAELDSYKNIDGECKDVHNDVDASSVKMSNNSENCKSIQETNSNELEKELGTNKGDGKYREELDGTGKSRYDDKADRAKCDDVVDLEHDFANTTAINRNTCQHNLNTNLGVKNSEDSETECKNSVEVLCETVVSSDAQTDESCAIQKSLETCHLDDETHDGTNATDADYV